MRKILLVILLLFTTISISVGYKPSDNDIKVGDELCMENIVLYMEELELDHIPILEAQITLETGNLKHKNNNNLFGFRTTKYLKFKTWKDCLDYKKIWQEKERKYKYDKDDEKSYLVFLVKVKYATDDMYIPKIKQIMNENKN